MEAHGDIWSVRKIAQRIRRMRKRKENVSTRPHLACEHSLHYHPIKTDMIYEDGYCAGHQMMRLSVLRSCRQIYVEANNIVWTTNTISFADLTAFKRFMMSRTIDLKRSIRSLDIHKGKLGIKPSTWPLSNLFLD